MQTLEQLAENVGFDYKLVDDDFGTSRHNFNRMGQAHWKVWIKYNGRTFETDFHTGAGNRVWTKSINDPGQITCRKGDRVVVPTRVSLHLADLLTEYTVPITPTLTDVLYCLVSDARCGECADFEEFCGEMGYDEDSREAERIFNACRDTFHQLNRMFDLDELDQLFQDY